MAPEGPNEKRPSGVLRSLALATASAARARLPAHRFSFGWIRNYHLDGVLALASHLFRGRNAAAATRRVLLQESPLAGYQFHRADSLWPFLAVGTELRLHREHLNPHDPHAIGVWHQGDKLGYVPRRENRTLAQMMDRGEKLQARIVRLLDDPNPWRRVRFQVDLVA